MYVLERTRHNEKRDYMRMAMDIPITLTNAQISSSISGRCRDLSGTGMLVETEQALTIGDIFEVSVPSARPDLDLGSLDAEVEVTRCIALDSGYEIGLLIRGIKA